MRTNDLAAITGWKHAVERPPSDDTAVGAPVLAVVWCRHHQADGERQATVEDSPRAHRSAKGAPGSSLGG